MIVMFAIFIIGWIVVSTMLITWGVLSIKDGDATAGSTIGLIIGVALAILFFVMWFSGSKSYTPTEEEIAQAQENYKEAYENTIILENYSMDMEISLKKGLFDVTISGDISKEGENYSGDVTFDAPFDKTNCTYFAEDSKWSKLYMDDDGKTKYLLLPFNAASLGTGIVCDIPEEILVTGVPTSAELTTIKFIINNEQAYLLYGTIVDYFKEFAGSDFDLSDLTFSEGTILVEMNNDRIEKYDITLKGKSSAGKITCHFIGEINK